MSFWDSAATHSGGPLTREGFDQAVKALEARDDWERQHPHGLDSENPHVVSRATRERLAREGGYAMCGVCGLFYIPPPEPAP